MYLCNTFPFNPSSHIDHMYNIHRHCNASKMPKQGTFVKLIIGNLPPYNIFIKIFVISVACVRIVCRLCISNYYMIALTSLMRIYDNVQSAQHHIDNPAAPNRYYCSKAKHIHNIEDNFNAPVTHIFLFVPILIFSFLDVQFHRNN